MDEKNEAGKFSDALRQVALSSYVTVFGTASFIGKEKEAPDSLPFSLSELPYAVSIGFRLSDAVMDSLVDRPTRTYQYHYRQVNLFIDQTLLRLLGKIHETGYKGFPVPSSQIVNWETNTGHLAHKVVAQESGLGWLGRNNLLVSHKYGARMRYGSLFTNMPLETGKRDERRSDAVSRDLSRENQGSGNSGGVDWSRGDDRGSEGWGCGECRACIKVCPASAIGEARENFDLAKCMGMLKVFSKEENIGSMICGLCIKACRGKGTHQERKSK